MTAQKSNVFKQTSRTFLTRFLTIFRQKSVLQFKRCMQTLELKYNSKTHTHVSEMSESPEKSSRNSKSTFRIFSQNISVNVIEGIDKKSAC